MTDAKKPEDTKSPGASQQDRPVEAASAAPGEKRSASRPRAPLARAAESGDPEVHKALADLQTAQMNAADHEAAGDRYDDLKKTHDEQVEKAQAALAELGYE